MRTIFAPYTQFLNQAVSGTATVTSGTTTITRYHNLGLQITFTGTMTGTLSVNCSNDNINFAPLTFSPTLTQPTGSGLTYLVNMNQVPFAYLQVSYTNSSGSGTLTSLLLIKDLG
jgi:hypothetical protein